MFADQQDAGGKPDQEKLPMTFDNIDWQGNKFLHGKPASPKAVHVSEKKKVKNENT